MGNALFIVWRETVEAMLVVGILHSWLKQHGHRTGMRYLWGGVAAGVGLAILLAFAIVGVADVLSDTGLEYFQLGMVSVAAALIVQMVFWMRAHGRKLKRELESSLADAQQNANWWGMLIVVALAVSRESSEAVVFLYGLGSGEGGNPLFWLMLPLGVLLAWGTFWLLQQSSRFLTWQRFFRISEVLLLLLAASLLVNASERAINLNLLPTLLDPVWDSSRLLSDSGSLGGFIANFTGYRAQPSLSLVLVYALFWLAVVVGLRHQARKAA
ncbi:FTR1 family protein [Vogesella sp. LIG4]|uniref:FTR1 family iron permease n=1 Tax=Vogesella sp. LIG4 TaxID=1192162 RepID=UPI0008200567|nr:FTR1 family protein [Vogesella sp. LIG4]SCK28659.1 high-affinity iron transporter [Vogesella sp. LIG4]